MYLHLAQFAGAIVPIAGVVLPIVLWQMKKADWPIIDTHGRIVVNWMISSGLYALLVAVVALALMFIHPLWALLGIPLLLVLAVLGVIYPVVGGVKASKGETWPYPLSIQFFALPAADPYRETEAAAERDTF